MRAAVHIPRSPTSTTRWRPKRVRILSTCAATVWGSLVEPSKTSTATGHPVAVQSRPKTICSVPFLPFRRRRRPPTHPPRRPTRTARRRLHRPRQPPPRPRRRRARHRPQARTRCPARTQPRTPPRPRPRTDPSPASSTRSRSPPALCPRKRRLHARKDARPRHRLRGPETARLFGPHQTTTGRPPPALSCTMPPPLVLAWRPDTGPPTDRRPVRLDGEEGGSPHATRAARVAPAR